MIHNLILGSGEAQLILDYKNVLRQAAKDRELNTDLFSVICEQVWQAYSVSENIVASLKKLGFQVEDYDFYFRSSNSDYSIKLAIIAKSLASSFLEPYKFDLEQRVTERGANYAELTSRLNEAFRCTVGKPSDIWFGALFDKTKLDAIEYVRDVLDICLEPPIDLSEFQEWPDFEWTGIAIRHGFPGGRAISLEIEDLDWRSCAISQNEVLSTLGIDPKSVYLIWFDPLALRMLASTGIGGITTEQITQYHATYKLSGEHSRVLAQQIRDASISPEL